jgi:hypothetical protein
VVPAVTGIGVEKSATRCSPGDHIAGQAAPVMLPPPGLIALSDQPAEVPFRPGISGRPRGRRLSLREIRPSVFSTPFGHQGGGTVVRCGLALPTPARPRGAHSGAALPASCRAITRLTVLWVVPRSERPHSASDSLCTPVSQPRGGPPYHDALVRAHVYTSSQGSLDARMRQISPGGCDVHQALIGGGTRGCVLSGSAAARQLDSRPAPNRLHL